MITKDLSTLKIHKLTQEQYDRELAADNLDETAIYLTPDEEIDLSLYATVEQLNNKANKTEIDTAIAELEEQVDYVGLQISEHKHSWNNLDNRPFGEEIIKEEILSETTLEFNATGYSGGVNIEEIGLTYGESYIVVWDNKEYQCICDSFSGEAIGDNSILMGVTTGNFSEEAPFLILSSGLIISKDTGSHTLKIEKRTSTIHKLDKKYLPEVESGVKSWNDLEDKPFYTEEKYTTLVPETTVTIQDFIEDAIDIDLVVGNTYFVIWDGTKYECICYDNNGDYVIGNDVCWGGNGGNGEPFLVSNYDGITAINVYDNGTHTISISAIIENIHQLDEKYIPDSVYDWNTLKNRPFGEETKKTVIIEEQIISFNNDGKAYPTVTGQYSIGTNVTILFDGIEYEAEVKDGFFLGDNYIVSRFSTIDDIEITIVWDGFCVYALLADTHTISVYIKETVIHKLPEEFIPDHSHSWIDLKDKPFGEILGYEICNKEQTFTVELSNSGRATANLQKDVHIDYFRVNLPTVVTLDGVEYTDLDIYESGGDMSIYIEFTNEYGDDIYIVENDYISMPPSYAGTTHTIEIKQKTKIVKKIDEKYLPNLIGKSGIGKYSEIFNDYNYNYADGYYSHAEGYSTIASGSYSHAEGFDTTASGYVSHAEGYSTIASGDYQHVQGKSNIDDTEGKYAHIVGNGTSYTKRSNAHTLDWDGNAEYQGDVKAHACGGETPISLVETAEAVKTKITSPITAEVGQIIAVKAVDENGKPTEFEAVEMPSGGSINEEQLKEAVDKALEEAKESGQFDGADGKTPEKGVDYFTEVDKAEFVTSVLNALPTWQGGAY